MSVCLSLIIYCQTGINSVNLVISGPEGFLKDLETFLKKISTSSVEFR